MTTDLSIIELITDASLVVQIVMGLLVIASLLSWTLILIKSGTLSRAQRQATKFEDRFWSGVELPKLYDELKDKKHCDGLERIFRDGFTEYQRVLKPELAGRLPMSDAVLRSTRVAVTKELDRLEQNLSFLATVASTSPYVGLFGTVWGIMNSFLSIGQMQQATLDVVAPGIAEALIATAIGLFAAIPALIAYNRFTDKVERTAVVYDTFREEFVALLERHEAAKRGSQ